MRDRDPPGHRRSMREINPPRPHVAIPDTTPMTTARSAFGCRFSVSSYRERDHRRADGHVQARVAGRLPLIRALLQCSRPDDLGRARPRRRIDVLRGDRDGGHDRD